MAVYQSQEPAIVLANFLINARVELVVQCHDQVALGGAILRQIVCLLRILLQVIDFKVVVGDQGLVSGRTIEMNR